MEVSNVVKVGGGILGTGAVVGSAGYGVYELANKELEEQNIPQTLREKFKKEGKIVLKVEGEDGYKGTIGTQSNETIWQLLVKDYEKPENKDKWFKDLPNLTEENKERLKVLQEKCTSVLDSTSFEGEAEAETWCTSSSSLLSGFLSGPVRPAVSGAQG